MKSIRRITLLTTASLATAATLAVASNAFAAAVPSASSGAAALSSAMPPVLTQGSIRYVSGGIGQDEERAMRAAEKRFPLTLEFIARDKPHPDFLADVPVTIRDHAGHTVLQAVSQGPFMLADLKPGAYTISARENGVTRTDHLNLAAHKPEKVVFEWDH